MGPFTHSFEPNQKKIVLRYINPRVKPSHDATTEGSAAKAKNFHDCFLSVFTQDNTIWPTTTESSAEPIFQGIIISEAIACFLSFLNMTKKIKKSARPGNITNAFLIRYAEWCSKYLSLIFKNSLEKSKIPPDWKPAKTIPMHRTGDRKNVAN